MPLKIENLLNDQAILDPKSGRTVSRLKSTGAAGRLTLHLVKHLGLSIDEKTIRRVGLDFWQDVDLRVLIVWHFKMRSK
jgi:tRNA(Leu) C34 or U34 (ribose-2'-O)-methylase TrmL